MKIKNIFSTLVLFLTVTASIAQQVDSSAVPRPDSSLAKVTKRINRFAFLWSRPVNGYEVTFIFKNTIQYVNCLSPLQIIDNSIKNATTESKVQNKTYDALIIGTSGVDTAIVFSDKTKDNSIVRVNSVNGKLLFAECKPMLNYEIVDKVEVPADKKDCPTPHEEKINKLILKADKSKKVYDAMIYGIPSSTLIKFKK